MMHWEKIDMERIVMNNPENERKGDQTDQQNSISGVLSDAELLELMYENGLIDLDEKYLAKPVNFLGHKEKNEQKEE